MCSPCSLACPSGIVVGGYCRGGPRRWSQQVRANMVQELDALPCVDKILMGAPQGQVGKLRV